jgi:hypothetical protein
VGLANHDGRASGTSGLASSFCRLPPTNPQRNFRFNDNLELHDHHRLLTGRQP